MIWSYRPYRNPVARRKYVIILSIILIPGLAAGIWKLSVDPDRGKFALGAFLLAYLFLASLLLRKPRVYWEDGGRIFTVGKSVDLREVRKVEYDEGNLVIRLEGGRLRELYFDDRDTFEKVREMIQEYVKS